MCWRGGRPTYDVTDRPTYDGHVQAGLEAVATEVGVPGAHAMTRTNLLLWIYESISKPPPLAAGLSAPRSHTSHPNWQPLLHLWNSNYT